MIKAATCSLLAFACLMSVSTSDARANAQTRHTLVVPGTCVVGPGTASAIFNHGGLTLSSTSASAIATATVTSTTPGIGLNIGYPIPQGNLTFSLVNNTPGVDNEFFVFAFYQNGVQELVFTSIVNSTSFSVNTVSPGLGQLQAVTLEYIALDGSVTVSNFAINGIRTNGFDLTHPQNCGSPYIED